MKKRVTRTDALIRDIANLFVQYPSSVWRPLVDDLLAGSEVHVRIAEEIVSLCAQASTKPKRTVRQPGKLGSPRKASPKPQEEASSSPSFSAHRKNNLEELWITVADRRLLPTAADLRELYIASGGKENLPKSRKSAMTLMFQHLDRLQDDQFEKVLEKLKSQIGTSDIDQDYKRWFNIIRKP